MKRWDSHRTCDERVEIMRRSVFVVDTMRLELVKASPDAGKSSMEIFYDNLSNIRKE